jgi:hypothetical protein
MCEEVLVEVSQREQNMTGVLGEPNQGVRMICWNLTIQRRTAHEPI